MSWPMGRTRTTNAVRMGWGVCLLAVGMGLRNRICRDECHSLGWHSAPLMDAVLFFMGILVICVTSGLCTVYALMLHHKREMVTRRIREFEVQQMALISDKMLERGMLPPSARRFYEQ